MSLFLKRQLYCCVMKSRCQKVFQRLEKNPKTNQKKSRKAALSDLAGAALLSLTDGDTTRVVTQFYSGSSSDPRSGTALASGSIPSLHR